MVDSEIESTHEAAMSSPGPESPDTEATSLSDAPSPLKLERLQRRRTTSTADRTTESALTPLDTNVANRGLTRRQTISAKKLENDLQKSYPAARRRSLRDSASLRTPRAQKLVLRPEHLDRIVNALVHTPMMQMHVRKQWWDDGSAGDDRRASIAESNTPSSIYGSSAESSTYSSTNSPTVTQALFEEEFARNVHRYNRRRAPVNISGHEIGGIALTDPSVQGCPVRFTSKNYSLGNNIVQAGQCSFLKIPYGTSVACDLRIEPPVDINHTCRVTMQMVNQVLGRKHKTKANLLLVEVDVTESFVKAGLTEFAAQADVTLKDIHIASPTVAQHSSFSPTFDWCSLADELQANCSLADTVERASSRFATLRPENCTMQVLTLMSELDRIKTQHQDFMVLQMTGLHDNGSPSGIRVPWVSQHLEQRLNDNYAATPESARRFREELVAAVTTHWDTEAPFSTKIYWDAFEKTIHCEPLIESAGGKVVAWVCFVRALHSAWVRRLMRIERGVVFV